MRIRQWIFYLIFLTTFPIWLPMLILLVCWGIAKNFESQINAGYRQLLTKDGGLQK